MARPQAGERIGVLLHPRRQRPPARIGLFWSLAETIADLSRYFRIEPGDLIYTGTPEGVGAVEPGDSIKVGIDRLGKFSARVVGRHSTATSTVERLAQLLNRPVTTSDPRSTP